MVLAAIDRYRRAKRHLFVGIDHVVARSAERLRGGRKDAAKVMQDPPVPDAVEALRELRSRYFIRFLAVRGSYEDAFNVTQTWLDAHGFAYDDLIIVQTTDDKLAYLTEHSVLVQETDTSPPFLAKLTKANVRFVQFPLGGTWSDIMPRLRG